MPISTRLEKDLILDEFVAVNGLRPGIEEKRRSLTPNGNVRYQLKAPCRDVTTHVIFEPLDFIARLVVILWLPDPGQFSMQIRSQFFAQFNKLIYRCTLRRNWTRSHAS